MLSYLLTMSSSHTGHAEPWSLLLVPLSHEPRECRLFKLLDLIAERPACENTPGASKPRDGDSFLPTDEHRAEIAGEPVDDVTDGERVKDVSASPLERHRDALVEHEVLGGSERRDPRDDGRDGGPDDVEIWCPEATFCGVEGGFGGFGGESWYICGAVEGFGGEMGAFGGFNAMEGVLVIEPYCVSDVFVGVCEGTPLGTLEFCVGFITSLMSRDTSRLTVLGILRLIDSSI